MNENGNLKVLTCLIPARHREQMGQGNVRPGMPFLVSNKCHEESPHIYNKMVKYQATNGDVYSCFLLFTNN